MSQKAEVATLGYVQGQENDGSTDSYSALRELLRKKIAVVGLIIIIVYGVAAIFADAIPLHPPLEMHAANTFEPPSSKYWLGTDSSGRDILSRLVHGTRVSFFVAVTSVTISTLIGTIIGLTTGYFGGLIDGLLMRFMDILFAFPAVLLGLAIIAALGNGPNKVVLAIAVVYTPIFARVARGPTLAVAEKEFVESARALGCGDGRIILRHILPNILAPLIVQVSLALSWALLTEAVFSFLGLGAQPPNPSWGSMLDDGRRFMELAPWMAIFPGLAIMLAVLGFNLLGDGLRDVLDPRLRNVK